MRELCSKKWGYSYRENPAPPPTLSQAQQALNKEGKKILSLSPGDPPASGYLPPQWLMDAVVQAMKDKKHGYAASRTPDLPKAMAVYEKEFNGVNYEPTDITPTPSSTSAMVLAYMALLDPGDEIVSPEPVYQQYAFFANYFQTRLRTAKSFEDNRWQPDLDLVRNLVNEKTKFIIINNPNNPSGAVYDDKTLKALIDIAGENEIPIFSDEIYNFITFDIPKSTSVAKLAKDVPVLVCNGMSKLWNITGWGVGYLAFYDPENNMPSLKEAIRMSNNFMGRMAAPIANAAVVGYQNYKRAMEDVKPELEDLKRRRDWLVKRVNEIKGLSMTKPEGSMFALPKAEPAMGKLWKSDVEFLVDLIKEELVTFVPGSNYNSPGHFRVGLLSSDTDLKEGFDRIERFMKKRV